MKILEMQKRILNVYYNVYCVNILYMASRVRILQIFMRNELMAIFVSIKSLMQHCTN